MPPKDHYFVIAQSKVDAERVIASWWFRAGVVPQGQLLWLQAAQRVSREGMSRMMSQATVDF